MSVKSFNIYYLFLLKMGFFLLPFLNSFSQNQVQVDLAKLNKNDIQPLAKDLVNIQQIGSYNQLSFYVQNQNYTNIITLQNGGNNIAELVAMGNTREYNFEVNQQGNFNYIFDISEYSDISVNKTYNQMGDNLTIMSYGANSISREMQINQFGNSRTVLIFNNN